jgi:hypothetical protein
MEGFERANRAACDDPGHPRSKLKSAVVRNVAGALDTISENIGYAREIASSGKGGTGKKPA